MGALFIAVLFATLIILGGVAVRIYTRPLDISGHHDLPDWLEAIKSRDSIAYPAHATLGSVLNRIGGDPDAAALQWIKAASHARNSAEIIRAAQGIASAIARSADPSGAREQICTWVVREGLSPAQVTVIQEAQLGCQFDAYIRWHVPYGEPIRYSSRPPIGGAHYDTPYPTYGALDQPIPNGTWVHNLEHGAVVLLYRCTEACPDLVADIRTLYAQLTPSRSSIGRSPRMLALPYDDMDHRIAVVAWGQVVEMDDFDARQIADFYDAHVDQGPECRSFVCPY